MPARLPENMIRKAKPELRDLPIGETVFVEATAMRVVEDLSCFLLPTIPFHSEKSIFNLLSVRRDAVGFHVAVLGRCTWDTDSALDVVKDWIPVASIVEDYDPEVDFEARGKRK